MPRAGLTMVLVLPDHETRNSVINFENPAITMLLAALVEPGIEIRIVHAQAGKDGVILLDLVRLALYHVWQADRLLRECLLEPLQRFLDGQDARAQTGSLGPPVNANVLCN